MVYQKIINLLDDTKNQPSKFRTGNLTEINDESRGKYYNSNTKLEMIITIDDNNNIIDFPPNNNNSISFIFIHQTGNGGTKDAEMMVRLKYLSNFWRTLQMPKDCILVAGTAEN